MVRRGGFYLKIPIFPKSRAGKIPSKMPLSPNEGAERRVYANRASVSETVEPENLNNCCQDIQGRICCIKVLGSGCCHALYENTQSAVKAMGISVEVEYITDLKKVMEYGVMSVPALVVNNKVVSTGKVLKTENVQKLLQKIVSEK